MGEASRKGNNVGRGRGRKKEAPPREEQKDVSGLGLDKICFFLRLFCFAFLLQILTHLAFYFTYFAYFLLQKFSLKLNTYN